MEKLMVVVAAVAMTTGTYAAAVNWSTQYEVCDATGSFTSFTSASMAYLIDVDALSQSSIYSAVSSGKTLADAVSGKTIASAEMSGGMISEQSFTVDATGTKNYYMVLFDSKLGDNGAIYFSEQMNNDLASVGTAYYSFTSESSASSIAANMTGFSSADGGWVAVPEPTSGLLLVLGMAGLMLRRRRA